MSRCDSFVFRVAFSRFFSLLAVVAVLSACAPRAQAQFPVTRENPVVADSAALKPPDNARVAIIEFADLECPMCGHENPILIEATRQYHVPWVRHDFPLRQHVWSFQAAVNARWFDTKSVDLGNEYRNQVFANQNNLASLDDLRQFTSKFAADHHIALPFLMDPQGKLAAEVKADYNLGMRLGVNETPTIWVVTNLTKGPGVPYIHAEDLSRLYTYLDEAESATGSEGAKPATHSHK